MKTFAQTNTTVMVQLTTYGAMAMSGDYYALGQYLHSGVVIVIIQHQPFLMQTSLPEKGIKWVQIL